MQASARAGEKPTEITKLGPGDFFGETGLLEGRGTRNSSVICTTPVEVLMIDNAMVSRDRRGCQGCHGVLLPHGHAALMPPPSSQPTSFSAAPSPAAPPGLPPPGSNLYPLGRLLDSTWSLLDACWNVLGGS